ncbi:MAG: cytochrome [Hyphomicrobiales bacterium]|nr:cytochrome [Hyphomicrobiales bacterium]
MSVFSKLRAYHATLAILAILAYLTAEWGLIHNWIGYTLAAVLLTRLTIVVLAPRFMAPPHWLLRRSDFTLAEGPGSPLVGKLLLVAIVTCLAIATASGVATDRGWPSAQGSAALLTRALADDEGEEERSEFLSEIHEGAANSLFVFVAFHVAHLMWFRRRYALSMIFVTPRIAERGKSP